VPTSASGDCGVDARSERVVDVKTGVRWIWDLMISWADSTEERSSGSVFPKVIAPGSYDTEMLQEIRPR